MLYFILVITLMITLPCNLWASSIDHESGVSNECLVHFTDYEQKHQIPNNILKSVSITESGKWHPVSKSIIPWPWAVNFQGKGYYYETKQEAIKAVSSLQKKGHKSIDVGCMQINLYYHPNAFKNLEEAFDPKKNISYGASFLKSNFDKYSNWHQAIASYHSDNKSLGWPYARKVVNTWNKLSNYEIARIGYKKQLVNNRTTLKRKTPPSNAKPLPSSVEYRRRKSDMFIKIHNSNPKNYKKIEEISNKAVADFGLK